MFFNKQVNLLNFHKYFSIRICFWRICYFEYVFLKLHTYFLLTAANSFQLECILLFSKKKNYIRSFCFSQHIHVFKLKRFFPIRMYTVRLGILFSNRQDSKICWFAVTRLGLQETCGSKKLFDAHS